MISLKGVTLQRSSLKLIPEDTLDRAVEILKAVANPFRIQIVNLLINGEYHVSEICKATGINRHSPYQIH